MSNGPPADLRQQEGPHVFVVDLEAPVLDEADHHHLARSLRLRDGDPLTISDGAGRWRTARFATSPEPTSAIVEAPDPGPPLTVAFALTKAGKPELVVQKATEMGIDRLMIFHGEHSVPRWDNAKAAKARVRLERVAREAAMQSRRVNIPAIEIVADLAAVADSVGAETGPESIARADFGTPNDVVAAHHRCIAVGPEGGWSATETAKIGGCVDLGPTVLRAETAALAAAISMTTVRHMGQAN